MTIKCDDEDRSVSAVVKDAAIGAGQIFCPVTSDTVPPTTRYYCDASLELRCPGPRPRK